MTMSEYVSVQNCDEPEESDKDRKGSWKPFLRQFLVSSCVWSQFFQFGLCVGAPTVIIPQMRAERGEQYVSREMASWMCETYILQIGLLFAVLADINFISSSAMHYAAVPWPPLLVILSSYIGRRYTFTFITVVALIGFSVLCAGDTPQYVLAGMIMQGTLTATSLTISLFILTEYSSPLYRGVFLTFNTATFGWAIWTSNTIGTFAHWHYIAYLGQACAVYNLVILFLWPESPYWLASKGRVEQCIEAHRWLKGSSQNSEKELREIIKGYEQYCVDESKCSQKGLKKTLAEKWRQIFVDMTSKRFYKTLLLCETLMALYQFLGKLVVSVYAIDIIKDITKSKHEAYKGMLILDGVTVLGMYVGCGLSKKLTRRMLLIPAGAASSVFLLIMSLYLFLVRFELILENKYMTMSLLTGYSLSVSCGPFILVSAVKGELIPLRLRGTSATISAMSTYLIQGTLFKIAPYTFTRFGMDGTFLFYGVTSGIFVVILYIYLPETKDRTLNQIQDSILGIEDTKPGEIIGI